MGGVGRGVAQIVNVQDALLVDALAGEVGAGEVDGHVDNEAVGGEREHVGERAEKVHGNGHVGDFFSAVFIVSCYDVETRGDLHGGIFVFRVGARYRSVDVGFDVVNFFFKVCGGHDGVVDA